MASSCTNGMGRLLLAEKPKVEELQMNWLRSEDLKEEKNVTAPVVIIAVAKTVHPPFAKAQTNGFACISAARHCSMVSFVRMGISLMSEEKNHELQRARSVMIVVASLRVTSCPSW